MSAGLHDPLECGQCLADYRAPVDDEKGNVGLLFLLLTLSTLAAVLILVGGWTVGAWLMRALG